MKRSTRIIPVLLAATLASGYATRAAHAGGEDIEVGGFAGLHLFSDENELGVWDSEDANSLGNSLALGVRLAYAFHSLLSVEGELGYMPSNSRDTDDGAHAFLWRAHALVHFLPPEKRLRPFAVLVIGAMSSLESGDKSIHEDTDKLLHGGLGVKYRVGCTWGVRGDARLLLPPSTADGSFTYDFEILFGAYKSFGTCESKPTPAPAPTDRDGDGIYDSEDKCPDEKEDADQYEDEDGCPDPDNDGDGIADGDDECPNEAETVNGVDEEDGCPEKDEDGDGLVGSQDSCPTEAEDKDGFEDENGCPDPDNDGDGIADVEDKCRDQPETANGYRDEDGCPDVVPAKVAKFTGTIKGIRFKTNSAVIFKSSYKVLNEAAKVLAEFPDLRVEIQGHTDNVGKDDKNMVLSQRRAESVKKYLVGKGIDESRLEAKGYGEDVPVADNKTKQGQAENRRVEFKLIRVNQ
jgi:OOP family OmpA-OmpF porin